MKHQSVYKKALVAIKSVHFTGGGEMTLANVMEEAA